MTPSSGADPDAARIARLDAAVRDLLALHDDPALASYRAAAVGAAVPFLPAVASLAAAASTVDQVVRCLRHHASTSSIPTLEPDL